MNKGTETKYEYDPMETQHDRSSEKSDYYASQDKEIMIKPL
jgi:hypothetical protein